MPMATRRVRAFDQSHLAAYAGVGAAITFIAAMTFGAIDAPSDSGRRIAEAVPNETTRLVSAEASEGSHRLR